jgi:hypothetical protein
LPGGVATGLEVDHSLLSSAEVDTEMNRTSSSNINGGSLKGYMCLMTKITDFFFWGGGGGGYTKSVNVCFIIK